MKVFSSRKLQLACLALLVIVAGVSLGLVSHSTFASSPSPSQPPSPSRAQIVAIAQQIENGHGVAINGWSGSKIVPYIYGGGHAPSTPGPDSGHHKACEPGQRCGVDCSGFTRWVYFLAYGKDVLNTHGDSSTRGQIQLAMGPSPLLKEDASATLGDLVFFGPTLTATSHVGIVIGPNRMIDSPNAYGHPPHYVRYDAINKGFGHVLGFYHYVPQTSPTPTATAPTIPRLASSYTGTIHNETYNITSNYALVSVTEDEQGNIRGMSEVSPPLYGSGPFTGTVRADNSLTFTSTATADGGKITFTGTVNGPTLSGNYTVQDGQIGTWQVRSSS